ncbi:hypothetical protein ACVIJ1_008729 [Bradyrhizobium elkanii]
MQCVPGEVDHDGPEHRVDQHARLHRAGAAPIERVEAHHAEDEHQWRCERKLGRDQLGDVGRPEILDPRAAHLLDERHPVVIGIPQDDGAEQAGRNQAAEIEPGREKPAPQLRHRRKPDQDRRTKEQRGVF